VIRSSDHDVILWGRDDGPVSGVDAIVVAVPAQAVRDCLAALQPGSLPVILAAKGIERVTGKLMGEVAAEVAPGAEVLVLSGPSFAADVLRGLPTAVVLAAASMERARELALLFALPQFRIYHSNDVRGVEIGGAVKNVLAIACGVADGRGLGESARAALITRGFAELSRLAHKMGARRGTLHGLSGLGDLLLTCSSAQSRNYSFGLAIGKGVSVAQALAQSRGVVEGAATAAAAAGLAQRYRIDMPITLAVHNIVDQRTNPEDVIRALLARPATTEFDEDM
jgi:glycerol-3-phosphate dehydrogenase (NAD(P)+)